MTFNYKNINYKEHVIEIGNLINGCYFDIIGEYQNTRLIHIDGFIEKINQNQYKMSIYGKTNKYIFTIDDRDIYTSFEDCINFLKHCIEIYLYD